MHSNKNNAHNPISTAAALFTLMTVWHWTRKMIRKYYGKLS